jgi:hypothetical protein
MVLLCSIYCLVLIIQFLFVFGSCRRTRLQSSVTCYCSVLEHIQIRSVTHLQSPVTCYCSILEYVRIDPVGELTFIHLSRVTALC